MISLGVYAMAMRRRLTAFTFGLYPARFESAFSTEVVEIAGDNRLMPRFEPDTFATSAAVGGALDVVVAYAREDILPVDTFAVAAVSVGGALDATVATVAYAREDILPVDTFVVAAVSLGGALDEVIAYARQELKPVDTFAVAAVSVGGALETV